MPQFTELVRPTSYSWPAKNQDGYFSCTTAVHVLKAGVQERNIFEWFSVCRRNSALSRWWDALLQEERDDFTFPPLKAGSWVLAASRHWTLPLINKLHPDPRWNAKDIFFIICYVFLYIFSSMCVPRLFHRHIDTAAALCLHIWCSVTLMNMQDPWQWFYSPAEWALRLVLK